MTWVETMRLRRLFPNPVRTVVFFGESWSRRPVVELEELVGPVIVIQQALGRPPENSMRGVERLDRRETAFRIVPDRGAAWICRMYTYD